MYAYVKIFKYKKKENKYSFLFMKAIWTKYSHLLNYYVYYNYNIFYFHRRFKIYMTDDNFFSVINGTTVDIIIRFNNYENVSGIKQIKIEMI